MAGHSHFANIKHKKDAQDRKKSKLFTKIQRNITIAAKSGLLDPAFNPKLKAAIADAKEVNLPKDKIEAALKKASGDMSGDEYEEVRYNGYSSGGVALIIETLTDNKNRTVSDVRSTLTKYSGNLGETGSVEFMFEKVGVIKYSKHGKIFDTVFEVVVDCGGQDLEEDEECFYIVTDFTNMHSIASKISERLGDYQTISTIWKPISLIDINDEQKEKLQKMIDVLYDFDDVQEIYHNANM